MKILVARLVGTAVLAGSALYQLGLGPDTGVDLIRVLPHGLLLLAVWLADSTPAVVLTCLVGSALSLWGIYASFDPLVARPGAYRAGELRDLWRLGLLVASALAGSTLAPRFSHGGANRKRLRIGASVLFSLGGAGACWILRRELPFAFIALAPYALCAVKAWREDSPGKVVWLVLAALITGLSSNYAFYDLDQISHRWMGRFAPAPAGPITAASSWVAVAVSQINWQLFCWTAVMLLQTVLLYLCLVWLTSRDGPAGDQFVRVATAACLAAALLGFRGRGGPTVGWAGSALWVDSMTFVRDLLLPGLWGLFYASPELLFVAALRMANSARALALVSAIALGVTGFATSLAVHERAHGHEWSGLAIVFIFVMKLAAAGILVVAVQAGRLLGRRLTGSGHRPVTPSGTRDATVATGNSPNTAP